MPACNAVNERNLQILVHRNGSCNTMKEHCVVIQACICKLQKTAYLKVDGNEKSGESVS